MKYPAVPLDDLPYDSNGRLTRARLVEALGGPMVEWQREGRLVFNVFCGSRLGLDPIYEQVAVELGEAIEAVGACIANGGGMPKEAPHLRNQGLMGASLEKCSRVYSFVPVLFTLCSGSGSSEGLNPYVFNIKTRDFYERKTAMMLLGDAVFALPGGIGTIEEALEAIIFGMKKGKTVVFINTNGVWDHVLRQLKLFQQLNLLPSSQGNVPLFCEAPTPWRAVSMAVEFASLRRRFRAANEQVSARRKPDESLYAYLQRKPNDLLDPVIELLSTHGRDWQAVPRVSVIASSHIGLENGDFNIKAPDLRREITANGAMLGLELARHEAALVITGTDRGQRHTIARAALSRPNTRIIWVQKDGTVDKPLKVTRKSDREIVLRVAREFEVDRLAEMLGHSFLGNAGGIHSASRMTGIITREQTGYREFVDQGCPNDFCRSSERLRFHVYSPLVGDNVDLFSGFHQQLAVCNREGFYGDRDLKDLIHIATDARDLATKAVEEGEKRNGERDPILPLFQAARRPPVRTLHSFAELAACKVGG
jgi:predicted Rossmann-fold nucleotide-binding protein